LAPNVSRGRITAVWLVLTTLKQLGPPAHRDEVIQLAKESPLRSGGLPIDDGLVLALRGRFAREEDGVLDLTGLGLDLLSRCQEDEPNGDVRRTVLTVLLLADPQPWVAFWQGDPALLQDALPNEERESLADSGLLPHIKGQDFASDAWWEALATVPRTKDIDRALKLIGDTGEALTVKFEQDRLAREGFPELAKKVWWAARESDAYGFDVASFAGKSYPPLAPDARLAIEVKSSSVPITRSFSFYLSRYEWQTATRLGSRHIFHLWDGVRPGQRSARRRAPILVRLPDVEAHLPAPAACNESCQWESARLTLAMAPGA
jgi:hypothetical protein